MQSAYVSGKRPTGFGLAVAVTLLFALGACGGGGGGGGGGGDGGDDSCGDACINGAFEATFQALGAAATVIGEGPETGATRYAGCDADMNEIAFNGDITFAVDEYTVAGSLEFTDCQYTPGGGTDIVINGDFTILAYLLEAEPEAVFELSLTSANLSVEGTIDGGAVSFICAFDIDIENDGESDDIYSGSICGSSFSSE